MTGRVRSVSLNTFLLLLITTSGDLGGVVVLGWDVASETPVRVMFDG